MVSLIRTDRQIYRQIDRQIYIQIDRQIYFDTVSLIRTDIMELFKDMLSSLSWRQIDISFIDRQITLQADR